MPKKFTKEEVKKLFKEFDNGNGHLSLAEIDRAVKHFHPELGTNKKAMMRAYKAADNSGNGFIELREFEKILNFLQYYDSLSKIFEDIDTDDDHRVSFDEFKMGIEKLGEDYTSEAELKKDFRAIDTNGGGYILFDEFCKYMVNKNVH